MEAAGIRRILHPSRSDRFSIWNISDVHLMSAACAEDRLREDVAKIGADPHAYWLGGGDYCDFIGHTDRRFDPDAVADYVNVKMLGRLGEVGMERARDIFRPIAGKCLGLLLGNHEKRYMLEKDHSTLHGWLCTELKVPNLGYSALFDVVFVRDPAVEVPTLLMPSDETPFAEPRFSHRKFRVFAHHGAGYAQTPGGKLNRLIHFMNAFDADLYFVGHVHDQVARRQPAIGASAACDKLVARTRLGMISGSYLKTYQHGVTTYGEQRGYLPTPLGAAVAVVVPETGEMLAQV